jgi:hypothetical protein
VSTPQSDQLREVIDRVLGSLDRFTGVEVASKLGVTDSYVGKLRSGWRPTRVREDLWRRLLSLDPQRSQNIVREVSGEYAVRSREYFAGKQDTLMEMMRWVVNQQAEIGHHLRQHTQPMSPTLEQIEAGEAALRQVAEREAARAGKKKRA